MLVTLGPVEPMTDGGDGGGERSHDVTVATSVQGACYRANRTTYPTFRLHRYYALEFNHSPVRGWRPEEKEEEGWCKEIMHRLAARIKQIANKMWNKKCRRQVGQHNFFFSLLWFYWRDPPDRF